MMMLLQLLIADNDDVIAAPVCLLPPGVPSDGAGRGVGLSERGRNE